MNIALFATTYRVGRVKGLGALLLVFAMLAALLPASALAANAVTPVTGGNLSADTNSVNGTSAFTTLGGPQVNGTGGTLGAGTVIFTIANASEFAFNSAAGTAGLTGAGCGSLAIGSGPTVVAASVTVTLTGTSSGTCNLVLAGLQVRPTALGAAPLETSAINTSGTAGVTGSAGTLTVVPGAGILQFTQGTIGNAAAGVDLSPQPTIHDEDQFSNPRQSDSITLSIKPGTGTSGATVACTANSVATNSSGNATFAGCNIDMAGTGYRLLASASGATAGESNLFNITTGAANKLFFLTQPSRGTPGGAFATQPVVEIEDNLGNRVTSDSTTTVTLAISTNPGSGTLTCSGGLTKTAVSGVATFAGCSINNFGVGYRLTASSSPVLTIAISNLFDVADRLVFTTQPSATTNAGTAFASQPVVAVRAGASNTVVNDQATVVTLSIKAGTGAVGGVLTCDSGLSKTVINGVASFTGCKIDKISPTSPANPYTIVASAINLTSAESTNVAITAGAASKLGFTAQPTSASSNQAFPIQPVVAVQDLGGNTVTSGLNSNATITLAIGTNPAAGTLTCTGGLTMVAVAGVATFVGCQINNAGAGYTLIAMATGLTGATSTPFTVGAPAATITLTTSAAVITWGSGIVLTTQFGASGAGRSFQLQVARDGVTWATAATLTTDASGRATFAYRPATNNYYRVVFAGAPDLSAATSATVRTVVRQIALLRPKNDGAIKSIARNTSITFTTTVRPARPELAPAKVSFSFYRMVSGSWVLKAKRDVFINAAGLARTTFKFTSSGQWYVRSAANPTTYNANSVPSPRERYNVF